MAIVERTLQRLAAVDPKSPQGVVRGVTGLLIESQGPPVPVGSTVEIVSAGRSAGSGAEVVGFRGGRVLLMPYEGTRRVRLGDRVQVRPAAIPTPDRSWIGRVVDGLGRPLDGGPALTGSPAADHRTMINPMRRKPISEHFETGVRAIDAVLTCARGQRVGLFGGSGVGKSTLMAQMARGSEADVTVIALIGERGREVQEFVDNELGPAGLAKAVVVASTSDSEALLRLRAAETALAAAEAFRDEGRSVLLILDSLTRVAMAQREVGLAAGEPPTSRGYTPSVFAHLPKLVERAGSFERGSITAFFTVLVDGDDMNEPVADAVRGLLDGHIVLSRTLGERGHFPAIDVSASLSRLMNAVASPEQREQVTHLRRLLGAYRRAEDLIAVGAYVAGQDPVLDEAVEKMPRIEKFLRQPFEHSESFSGSVKGLHAAVA